MLPVLRRHRDSRVRFPNEIEMQRFAEMIKGRESSVNDVIGFMDGLALSTECTSEPITQNAYYNGYHADTFVSNVFAFGPDGKIFLACINFPGSWNDANVVAPILEDLATRLNGRKICVDQGFPRSGPMSDVLVGPLSQRQVDKLPSSSRADAVRMSNVYTSLRQTSEWGMRGIQATFSRLKAKVPSDSNKRHNVIEACVLLHNFRTERENINQIKEVFSADYEQYCNLSGHERIRRYFRY
jgi:hypothetical protein